MSSQLPFTVDQGLSWFILIHSKGKLTWNSPIGCGVSFESSWWERFHSHVETFAYWVWHSSLIGECVRQSYWLKIQTWEMKDTFVEFVVAYVSHSHVHLEVKMGARFSLEVSRPNTHTLSLFHLLQKWEKESLPKTAKRSRKWPHLFFQNHCFFLRKNPTNFSDVLIAFLLNASLLIISKT